MDAAEEWERWGAPGILGRLVARGQLTQADADEVEETLDVLLGRLRSGQISLHFFEWVVRRLADEKAAAWLERMAWLSTPDPRDAMATAAPCARHDSGSVCDAEGLDTGSDGFVHRSLLKGRIALRTCRGCGELKCKADWSQTDWFRCKACVGNKENDE